MGTHPIFESDFDCLTVRMSKQKSKKSRKDRNKNKERFEKHGPKDRTKKIQKTFVYSKPIRYNYKRSVQYEIKVHPDATHLGIQTRKNVIRYPTKRDVISTRFRIHEYRSINNLEVTVDNPK